MTSEMDHDGVAVGVDPTKAILGKSALYHKYLCDLNINTAVGCRHGCEFCYVPASPQIRTRAKMLKEEVDVEHPQGEWGEYVLHRPENTAERLRKTLENKRTWRCTRGGRGIVAMSFGTDCYQDDATAEVTTACLDTLTDYNRPDDGGPIYVRILTRNPVRAAGGVFKSGDYEGERYIDIYEDAGKRVTVGSSIPCLNSAQVHAIEPRAPDPHHRLRGLKMFNNAGVNTYISMSPTYPSQTKSDIRNLMETVAEVDPDVIFHEPINVRGGNFKKLSEALTTAKQEASGDAKAAIEELLQGLNRIRDEDEWFRYAINHYRWVQQIGEELDLPVHLWPDDRLIIGANEDEEDVGPDWYTNRHSDWAAMWRVRQSPENFAERPTPGAPHPTLPPAPPQRGATANTTQQTMQQSISDY